MRQILTIRKHSSSKSSICRRRGDGSSVSVLSLSDSSRNGLRVSILMQCPSATASNYLDRFLPGSTTKAVWLTLTDTGPLCGTLSVEVETSSFNAVEALRLCCHLLALLLLKFVPLFRLLFLWSPDGPGAGVASIPTSFI